MNTHTHADHIGANGLFAAEAPVIAHLKARERFLQRYYNLPPINPEGVPVITFEDTLTLYFNGEKIILKHVKSDTFKKYKNWERKKDWVEVINTKLFGKK